MGVLAKREDYQSSVLKALTTIELKQDQFIDYQKTCDAERAAQANRLAKVENATAHDRTVWSTALRLGGGIGGDALAIAALVTSVGFTVSRRTGSATWVPGEVAFTSSIAKVRRKHGDEMVRAALVMMAEAFPAQRLVAGSSIFTAICAIMVSPPPAFDRARLEAALRTFDMKGWAEFLTNSKGGDDRASKLRQMLLAAYEDVEKAA